MFWLYKILSGPRKAHCSLWCFESLGLYSQFGYFHTKRCVVCNLSSRMSNNRRQKKACKNFLIPDLAFTLTDGPSLDLSCPQLGRGVSVVTHWLRLSWHFFYRRNGAKSARQSGKRRTNKTKLNLCLSVENSANSLSWKYNTEQLGCPLRNAYSLLSNSSAICKYGIWLLSQPPTIQSMFVCWLYIFLQLYESNDWIFNTFRFLTKTQCAHLESNI